MANCGSSPKKGGGHSPLGQFCLWWDWSVCGYVAVPLPRQTKHPCFSAPASRPRMPRSGKGHKRKLDSAQARAAFQSARRSEPLHPPGTAYSPDAVLLTIEALKSQVRSSNRYWLHEAINLLRQLVRQLGERLAELELHDE